MIALYLDGRVDLDASHPEIEMAVRSLDGADHTLLVVELPSGATITVGGGPNRFVVEVAENANDRWTVLDPRRPEGRVELVVGGERVDPPARLCVDGEAALEAVHTFVSENGARSPRLQWSAET
ncbi:MAG: hypothetical protein HYU51_19945 [Candidatus Rokubacteria bacterium]|nr:hypothetical protein [Candidatus Rokubacteria bacterium]